MVHFMIGAAVIALGQGYIVQFDVSATFVLAGF